MTHNDGYVSLYTTAMFGTKHKLKCKNGLTTRQNKCATSLAFPDHCMNVRARQTRPKVENGEHLFTHQHLNNASGLPERIRPHSDENEGVINTYHSNYASEQQ